MRILAICGSLQARSTNLALLETAARLAPQGIDVVIFDGIRDLPLFNPDLEVDGAPPAVEKWRRAIAESDAMLISSPEYGFSLPGGLKNAIDWTIGSGELERKIIAITSSVNYVDRGRRGLEALRNALSAVSAIIVSDQPLVRGPMFNENVAGVLTAIDAEVKRRSLEGE